MMIISSKCVYGLAALFELACAPIDSSLQIRKIAKAQSIPEDYLRQLLVMLKKTGFIKSRRGKAGGYVLAKPASEITVKEIIEYLDGPMEISKTRLKDDTLYSYFMDCQMVIETSFHKTLEELAVEKWRKDKYIIYHI